MPNSVLLPARDAFHDKNQGALRRAYKELEAEGVRGIHYLADAPFLGTDGEGTVDGSHPNDLGMVRYADALEAALKPILKAR
jgi:lysophospholipase L1-like esterase